MLTKGEWVELNLDIFENLIDKVKENEFIQNFTKELEKNMENKKAFGHALAIFTIFILLQQEDSDL